MATGKIGVTTENIFPVIKKFLYSDHEIFLRELVSNAIDATQKLKTLASFGDFKGELGEMNVKVTIDKEAGTLTVSDHGIGMDKDDIDKYINQIAFSGAEEFVAKYKDTANSIIGHFGLGFYSAFMVSKKVEIRSLSYKGGAKAVMWVCDGSPEYEMSEIEKDSRGTDIILYIDDESKEFLDQSRIDTLLKKYCRFLPVPVVSGKEQEWKEGKYVDTDKDKVINATEPLWTKKPADLTDDDYIRFYHELMPGQEDPMFWIHLNVDYPFTLTGILYFPKIKSNVDIRKDRIQLYCNQVYVTDQVEGVVPEFMMLMQGVIDSPDIPLNVSRSYLQSDRQVKQISGYIAKKVSEKLDKMFKDNRASFEEKWDDIKVFIEYGMLTDEKFFDSAKKFFLLKTVDDKYFTLDEYKSLVEANQTDKDGNVIYIYANDKTAQYSYIKACEDKGYSVLIMNGELDPHITGAIESKDNKVRFVRVDSGTPEHLIPKAESQETGLSAIQTEMLSNVFRSQIPESENAQFIVTFEPVGQHAAPVTIIQNEYMRRMKDMAAMQPGGGMFGNLPDNYSLVVNTDQDIVKTIIERVNQKLIPEVQSDYNNIEDLNSKMEKEFKEAQDKKQSPDTKEDEEKVAGLRKQLESKATAFANDENIVRQIIDLALLQSGLLKGEELNKFINRSIALLSK
ncbi:MAG: molecular chaperone HtpG [Prevotella sp.]|nr:molecular chaperone HtpG [Bacteroides sp.]MCM1365898.1 molecular chaperone HtpG [Prevotella sp.]